MFRYLSRAFPSFGRAEPKMTIFIFRQKLADTAQYENMFSQYIPQRVFSLIPIVFLLKNSPVTLNSQLFFPFYVFVNKARRILVLLWQDSRFNWEKNLLHFSQRFLFSCLSLPPLSYSLSRAHWNKWWRERVCGSKWVCVRYLLTHMWVECNFRLDSFKLNKPTYCIHRFSFFPICLWKNRLGSNQQS